MDSNIITLVLNKISTQSPEYSIGFRRLSSLPIRVRTNINLACVLKGEENDNSMKEFLNELSEEEFINWLKVA